MTRKWDCPDLSRSQTEQGTAFQNYHFQDLSKVGTLIGLKSFVNEFVAYSALREMRAEGVVDPPSERSVTIATYALCGFSNPASIGIQIATLGTMAPERKGDIARVAVR